MARKKKSARCSTGHGTGVTPPVELRDLVATATPQTTIAGHLVTLVAWLDDPEARVKCPTITWVWPNGTTSSHTSDCDPDEAVTRHQEIKQGVLPAGQREFSVAFASGGREWRAAVTVPVL